MLFDNGQDTHHEKLVLFWYAHTYREAMICLTVLFQKNLVSRATRNLDIAHGDERTGCMVERLYQEKMNSAKPEAALLVLVQGAGSLVGALT